MQGSSPLVPSAVPVFMKGTMAPNPTTKATSAGHPALRFSKLMSADEGPSMDRPLRECQSMRTIARNGAIQ